MPHQYPRVSKLNPSASDPVNISPRSVAYGSMPSSVLSFSSSRSVQVVKYHADRTWMHDGNIDEKPPNGVCEPDSLRVSLR